LSRASSRRGGSREMPVTKPAKIRLAVFCEFILRPFAHA
jgi:hypothetical protein